MKIVKIILIIIFGLVLGIFILSNVKLEEIKTKNKNINTEIIETNVDSIKEKNAEYQKQLESLKEAKKADLEELEIWQDMLKRLETASM